MSQFVVGQRYVTMRENVYPPCGLSAVGVEFTCAMVDNGGGCWVDCDLNGHPGRWVVATLGELLDGDVVLAAGQDAPHVLRMVDEYSELRIKFDKLLAFLRTDTYAGLHEDDQYWLNQQLKAMNSYANILDTRINRARCTMPS